MNPKKLTELGVLNLVVFRMGAPETAQNSKYGPIQQKHDFPHFLCDFRNVSSKMPDHPFPTSSLRKGNVSSKMTDYP